MDKGGLLPQREVLFYSCWDDVQGERLRLQGDPALGVCPLRPLLQVETVSLPDNHKLRMRLLERRVTYAIVISLFTPDEAPDFRKAAAVMVTDRPICGVIGHDRFNG